LPSAGGVACFGPAGAGSTFRLEGDFVDVAIGGNHACFLRADGTVNCVGENTSGQLGTGNNMSFLYPPTSPGVATFVAPPPPALINGVAQLVAGFGHTCARRVDGNVSCWGRGSALGDQVGNNRNVPFTVPGLSGVLNVRSRAGDHTCVELTDRTASCWGDNTAGEIGDGTFQFASKPTPMKLQ
jgi:alpha-tubulin suppressor-like RCC1 family protein